MLAVRLRPDDDGPMRYESCVISLSWIPSEAITGATRMPFDAGVTHYDEPPPGELGDIEALRAADRFRPVLLPLLQRDPEHGDGWVRFVQTAGGRTGIPAPRRVRRKPFVQWQAPLAWTTMSLTLYADGKAEAEM